MIIVKFKLHNKNVQIFILFVKYQAKKTQICHNECKLTSQWHHQGEVLLIDSIFMNLIFICFCKVKGVLS